MIKPQIETINLINRNTEKMQNQRVVVNPS